MKKEKIVSLITVIILVVGIIVITFPKKEVNEVIKSYKQNINNSSSLSIMLETDADSGEYEMSSNSTWPTGDYVFNKEMSKCENGSTIDFDSSTKRVNVYAITNDKCYVYFDYINSLKVTGQNYIGNYDKKSHGITLNISEASYNVYYSTSLALNESNYTNGSQTAPTFINASTNTIYWCVLGSLDRVTCGNNTVKINKVSPTLTLSSNEVTTAPVNNNTANISYEYDGDGTLSCIKPSGSTGTCTINTTTKTIEFLNEKTSGNYTIVSSEGTNYLSTTQIVALTYTCLDENTLVLLWDRKRKRKRKKKIKDIKKGDIVYSYNYLTDTLETKVVKKVHINFTKEICHLYINGEDIQTTRKHAYYVRNLGYVTAEALKVGQKIVGYDGKEYEIDRIVYESLNYDKKMYCLELEDGTSFIIGKLGLVSQAMFVGIVGIIMSKPLVVAAGY